MIMKGPTTEGDDSQACITVAQLILFNSISRARDREANSSIRHNIQGVPTSHLHCTEDPQGYERQVPYRHVL